MPSASHWHGPIKWREISPSSRRLGGAEDQSYLQQSASGGTSPHYWTFWAANKLGGVKDGASFYLFFSLCSIFFFLAKAVSVLPSLLLVELLSTLCKTFSVTYRNWCVYRLSRLQDASSRHLFLHRCCSGYARDTGRHSRLAWMKITQWPHSRHGDTHKRALCVVWIRLCPVKRRAPLSSSIMLYIILLIFFLINLPVLRWLRDALHGVNDHSTSCQKEWNSSILILSMLMTSRRGPHQRRRMIVATAVLPRRTIWLISKGPRAGKADATWRSSD